MQSRITRSDKLEQWNPSGLTQGLKSLGTWRLLSLHGFNHAKAAGKISFDAARLRGVLLGWVLVAAEHPFRL